MKKKILAPLSMALMMVGGSLASLQAADSAGISGTVTTLPADVIHRILTNTKDGNGDGKSDILLRKDSGRIYFWGMNNNKIALSHKVYDLATNWKVIDSGDYDGDGKSDILLRKDSGRVTLWNMDGNNIVHSNKVYDLSTNWQTF